MNEFQIQLKPGRVPHFKTAVRAFDKKAIITSISNSSINFNLKTVMDPVDVSCLTSVKTATQINKEEVKNNSISSISEKVEKVNMDPLGYMASTPSSYFTAPTSVDINGNPTKSFFTVIENSEPKQIKRKPVDTEIVNNILSLSQNISEKTRQSDNFVIVCKDRINNVASIMETEISECSDKDKKLELLQDYVNFLKYTKLLF